MVEDSAWINNRFDKIDNWMQRLTEVSVDLKSMLAVHEQRLTQVDKQNDYIEEIVEKRRVELDQKVDDIYNTMRDQDNKILEELKSLREDTTKQHQEMTAKITKMEQFMWMAIGGGMVAVWLLSYVANYFKILGH
jgi:vacuolar-type H+-ATPase subunit H